MKHRYDLNESLTLAPTPYVANTTWTDGCKEYAPEDPTEINSIHDLQLHHYAWIVSGICAIIATALSFYLIWRHTTNYNQPKKQRQIIRILFMVPIYSLDSWLSFYFYNTSVYFDLFRDTYEAYVIYTFFALLIEYMGGEQEATEIFNKKPPMAMVIPLCCTKIFNNTKNHFLRRCKQSILQYVVIRPICTLIAVILEIYGNLCSGSMSITHGSIWITLVVLTSVSISMYALVQFYEVTKTDLAKEKPLLKFIAIKFVIFFSFWQSIVVSGLLKLNIIHYSEYWTDDRLSSGIQNGFICCEMVLAALLHIFCFGWKEYELPGQRTPGIKSLIRAMNPWDVMKESKSAFTLNPKIKRKIGRLKQRIKDKESEYKLTDMDELAMNDPDQEELGSDTEIGAGFDNYDEENSKSIYASLKST